MREAITPIQFAHAVHATLGYRQRGDGTSTYEAARYACAEGYISDQWVIPILSFINDSPASAEAWCERVRDEALVRTAAKMETTHD